MCIAAPGKVVKIEGQKALVEYPGEIIRQAMIANEKVKLGSYVLVQMGIIIDILSKSQSLLAQKAWQKSV